MGTPTRRPCAGDGCCRDELGEGSGCLAHGEDAAIGGGGMGEVPDLDEGRVVSLVDKSREELEMGTGDAEGRAAGASLA
jgi:hypothetical protein